MSKIPTLPPNHKMPNIAELHFCTSTQAGRQLDNHFELQTSYIKTYSRTINVITLLLTSNTVSSQTARAAGWQVDRSQRKCPSWWPAYSTVRDISVCHCLCLCPVREYPGQSMLRLHSVSYCWQCEYVATCETSLEVAEVAGVTSVCSQEIDHVISFTVLYKCCVATLILCCDVFPTVEGCPGQPQTSAGPARL